VDEAGYPSISIHIHPHPIHLHHCPGDLPGTPHHLAPASRPTAGDLPRTPHRLDAYEVAHKYLFNALSPQSCRQQIVESCAEAIARKLGTDKTELAIEKMTEFESSEKWAIRCDPFLDFAGFRHNLTQIALRTLLGALLHKLGYREITWTETDVAQWEGRKTAFQPRSSSKLVPFWRS
jgi:hypothetical protein